MDVSYPRDALNASDGEASAPAMTIPFQCTACARRCDVPRSLIGRRVRCRGCGHVQRIAETAMHTAGGYELAGPPLSPSTPIAPIQPPPRRSRVDAWRGAIRVGILGESQVQELACALVALSAADLFMTFTLLRTSRVFVESNPVANWFFARWNIAGMVLFKFAVIGGVIALTEIIERRRPGLGRFVLMIGCVGAGYAFYKGLSLFVGHAGLLGPGG